MTGSVLIIEDVAELSQLVARYLSREGLEVQSTENAEAALGLLETWEPDLIVLDLNLPGMDGFEFLQSYRKKRNTPVMIVSARNSDEDLISGFSTGADEFVTKPFSPRVLAARVRALLQRIRQSQGKTESGFRFGPFTLDFDSWTLKRGDKKIALSTREYEVLAYLARHAGKPLGPEQIYRDVWKNPYGDLTTVAVYIQRLRKKMEDDPGEPEYIETVHGKGYRMVKPEPVETENRTENP